MTINQKFLKLALCFCMLGACYPLSSFAQDDNSSYSPDLQEANVEKQENSPSTEEMNLEPEVESEKYQEVESEDYHLSYHDSNLYSLLGKPCSGKGTLAKMIAEEAFKTDDQPNVESISLGSLMREALEGESGIENEVLSESLEEWRSVLAEGGMVEQDPAAFSFLLGKIFKPTTRKNPDIILLDGAPRTEENISLLEAFNNVKGMFYVDISDELAMHRMQKRSQQSSEGSIRADDKAAVLQKRLLVFSEHTLPVIKNFYYEPSKTFVHILVTPESFEFDDSPDSLQQLRVIARACVACMLSEDIISNGKTNFIATTRETGLKMLLDQELFGSYIHEIEVEGSKIYVSDNVKNAIKTKARFAGWSSKSIGLDSIGEEELQSLTWKDVEEEARV